MTTYRDTVLADNPTYYWGLNDALGAASLASAVPGGSSLSIVKTPILQQPGLVLGSADACAKFDAGAMVVSASAYAAPNVFSMECLIKTSATNAYVIGHSTSTAYDRHLYIGSSGRLFFGVFDTANRVVMSSNVVADGKPHHIFSRVVVGGVLSVWIDGVKQGEDTFGPTFFAYSPNITIGRAKSAFVGWPEADGLMPFSGFIDEPAVYLAALSDTAIARHAQVALRPSRLAGTARLDNGAAASRVLVRNWDSDETVGSAIPDLSGAWQIYVPPGNYEVTSRGPAGYQPVTHGPVIAVSDI